MKRDESGILLNWLLKLVAILAVLGVIAFDVGSIVVNTVTLDGSARDVAIAVSIDVDQSASNFFTDQQIFDMAVAQVNHETEGISGAKVLRNGTGIDEDGVIHVRLRRKAKTLVTGLIGPLEKFAVGKADGSAGS